MIKSVDNNFKELVLDNKKITLVDFYANWCGPCRTQAPILEKLSEKNDWLDVVKVDVDSNQEIAFDYAIQSIPTLMIFKNGESIRRLIGLTSETDLIKILKELNK